MTIFTASQAVQANATYTANQAQLALTALIAHYQYVFDKIQASSTLGNTSLTLNFNKFDYNNVLSLLTGNGYTVSSLPADGVASTDIIQQYPITITWGVVVTTHPSVTALAPTTITGIVNNSINVQFLATGGTSPYTWVLTGSLPAGVTFNTSTGVLAGTPTTTINEYNANTVTVTDHYGNTFSQPITITINPPYIPTTGIQLLPDLTAAATLNQTQRNIFLAIALGP